MLQIFRESIGRYVAVGLLGLIAVTFIFWGVDFSATGATFAAKVNGETIDVVDFERELQNQQNQYQQLYRLELTEDLRRQLRSNVINQMVRGLALEQRVEKSGYRVSDARVADYVRSIDAFKVSGEFSPDVYKAVLQTQGLTPRGFEAEERRQLTIDDLQNGLLASTFLTPAEFRRYIELTQQRRQIAYAVFRADDFLDQVQIDDERISEHYESNRARYMTEETVQFEYVELDKDTIAANIEVDDDALHAYYEDQIEQYQTGEERRVRHVLITVKNGDEEAARMRAEEALARIRGGEDFSAVAAEMSDDASPDGSLGWVAPGMFEGPLEDAIYSMKVGEVAGPVRSDFGYHVLILDEIRPSSTESFEDVRDELVADYRDKLADEEFYKRANELADRAFDAYDELATVATGMNLPLNTVSSFPRSGDSDLFENSAAVVQAAFDPDTLNSETNSPLVDLSDDHVMVLRVTGHELPAPRPLEEVSGQIEEELRRDDAEVLAAMAKAAFLNDVAIGDESQDNVEEHGGVWTASRWIERSDPDVPTEIVAAAFNLEAPADDEPVRDSVFLASGDQGVVLLYGVEAGNPDAIAADARDQRRTELARQAVALEMSAYVGNVVADATVRIPEQILEPSF
jgi:peptidyl-prolyl cis-trans isomerase D